MISVLSIAQNAAIGAMSRIAMFPIPTHRARYTSYIKPNGVLSSIRLKREAVRCEDGFPPTQSTKPKITALQRPPSQEIFKKFSSSLLFSCVMIRSHPLPPASRMQKTVNGIATHPHQTAHQPDLSAPPPPGWPIYPVWYLTMHFY